MKSFSPEIGLQIHSWKGHSWSIWHISGHIFFTTRNHLPYDQVDDDPSQEEGPQETPLVITIVMIVVVRGGGFVVDDMFHWCHWKSSQWWR